MNLVKKVIMIQQLNTIQKLYISCLTISKLYLIEDLLMIKFLNLRKLLKIILELYKLILTMPILTTIKVYLQIVREITMKLLSVFLKPYPLNLIKLISIIIGDLHIEKRENSIMQSRIIKMLSREIQIILKHTIIELFVGTN